MQGQVLVACFLVTAFAGSLIAADGTTGTTTNTNNTSSTNSTGVTVNTALGPVVVANYTALGAVPLSTQQTTQCQCQGFFTKNLKVCGTNGFTYATACQLFYAMRLNKTLGLRCSRACPCPDYADQAAKAGSCSPQNRLAVKNPRKLNFKILKSPIKVFCLTDGTEETRGTVFCRMANNASIGIRAMGSCSEFNTYNCPARLLQTVPLYEDIN